MRLKAGSPIVVDSARPLVIVNVGQYSRAADSDAGGPELSRFLLCSQEAILGCLDGLQETGLLVV
jgi:hypothetical protein